MRFAAVTAALLLAGNAQTSEPADRIQPYLTPQLVVEIAPGRTMNLVCRGQGSPTVILIPGLGGWSFVWSEIQPTLSRKTRVCAWDPAGLGFSSGSPEPQDALHQTFDLEKTLSKAHIEGPLIVAAHSAGGLVALLLADRHPSLVVGMVLIDPSIPDQTAIRERVAPAFASFGENVPKAAAARWAQCAARIRSGELKDGTPEFDHCTRQSFVPAEFTGLLERLSHLNAMDPARLDAQASANLSLTAGAIEAINPRRRYGDMPLVVLTAGQHPMPPSVPPDVRTDAAKFFKALAVGHKALAALSTRGREELVPDSQHLIQLEKPGAVLRAIDSVLPIPAQ